MSRFDDKGFKTLLGRTGSLSSSLGIQAQFQDRLRLHEEFINNRGELLVHEIGTKCPSCTEKGRSSNELFRNLDCDRCEGDGFLFVDPVQIKAIVSMINQTRDLSPYGFLIPGDCLISTSPNLLRQPATFDRITFTWPMTVDEGFIIERGEDNKRFKEIGSEKTIPINCDRLYYQGEFAILVQDEDGVRYHQESDFVFDKKYIKWVGNQPKIGVRYVIKYQGYLEWLVFMPPAERRDKGANLGPRVALRKFHTIKLGEDPDRDPPNDKINSLFHNDIEV